VTKNEKRPNVEKIKIKVTVPFCLWVAATLIVMAAIFWFSSQTADESGELSGAVTAEIENFAEISGELLEIAVRKAAHLFIYSVLGFCVAGTMRQITRNRRYIFLISLAFCFIYAVSDEIHQYFVPGRACMWQDVVLDTVGAIIGITAALVIFMHRRAK
jgi:VanZ family protein